MGAIAIQDTHRRAYERAELVVEITYESDHNFFMGLSENISEGGLFVATHVIREVGTRIELTFALPGDAGTVKATAEVRWLRLYSESSDAPPGLGLAFVELTDEH